MLDERVAELTAWEESTLERSMMVNATYIIAFAAIALFVFIDIVYSARFSATENHWWLITMLCSIIMGVWRLPQETCRAAVLLCHCPICFMSLHPQMFLSCNRSVRWRRCCASSYGGCV